MKTKILKIKGTWEDVVNACRASVGKEPLGHEPSEEFKRKMMINEHGPLRKIWIEWTWPGIKYWCAMHWKTHIWPALTNTQRNDRQDQYDRDESPQKSLVNFFGEANPQHLIDTMRKRLCFMADPETREYAVDLKKAIRVVDQAISDGLVPNCVYRCGCPENGKCKFYKNALKEHPKLASTDSQERYDEYNRIFYMGGDGDAE